MVQYARVDNSATVQEFFIPPDGVTIDECFAPAIASQFVPIPEGVSPQHGWHYDGTTFSAPPAPEIPLDVQASQQLAAFIATGIHITSTSNSALDCTMALDTTTMNDIGPVATGAAANMGFPGDTATFTYPDINGQPRTFTEPQFIALYKAQRNLLFALNEEASKMAHGGTPSWPSQTAQLP